MNDNNKNDLTIAADNQTQKPIYFVFSGVRGVLFDEESGFRIHGTFFPAIDEPILKKESVEALNLLIRSLEQKYDTRLVITSQHRKDLSECARYLSRHNVEYDKPIYATKFVDGYRGKKIVDFMQNAGEQPVTKQNVFDLLLSAVTKRDTVEGFDNYVVLECEASRVNKIIPKERTIKTKVKDAALSVKNVMDYLTVNNLPIDEAYLSSILPKKAVEFGEE